MNHPDFDDSRSATAFASPRGSDTARIDAAANPPHKILVVDDDQASRDGMVRLLEVDGYRAWGAADGREAIELAEQHLPDLVLLDVAMPEVDGYEVCRRLNRAVDTAPLVIFVSALVDPAARIRGLETGAVDYISKPFHVRELKARVRAALRTKARIDTLAADAATDPLTGLLNRGNLWPCLSALIASAERYGRRLGCMLIDLDEFKKVNDEHGHEAGDDVLREVARRFHSQCRGSDSVLRYGGEEFLILAPETPPDAASALAARIKHAISSRPFVVRSFGRMTALPVTISVGLANWHGGLTGEQLIARADGALLRAKRSGRDRVVVADGSGPTLD